MAATGKKQKTKAKAAATTATANAQGDAQSPPQDVPFLSRVVIMIVTSYLAEKIWRNRKMVSEGWYSDQQSSTERAMITAFEYILAMGALFFTGIFVSIVTVKLQRRLGL